MNQNQFPSDAVETLAGKIHDPVFFDKLAADWNISPRNQQEQEQLLELALHLRNASDTEQVKTASEANPFLSGALDSLKVAMGAQGYQTGPTSDVMTIKNVAAQVAQDPAMQKAALDYGAYLVAMSQGR